MKGRIASSDGIYSARRRWRGERIIRSLIDEASEVHLADKSTQLSNRPAISMETVLTRPSGARYRQFLGEPTHKPCVVKVNRYPGMKKAIFTISPPTRGEETRRAFLTTCLISHVA